MQRRQSFSVLAVASILIIGAVGGVLGGCTRASDGSDSVVSATTQEARSESETATTIPAETTSTTAELTEEEAIIAAVNGYWQAFFEANDPPDPDHPLIDRFVTGEARDGMIERIETRKFLNQAIRFPTPSIYEASPFVTMIQGDNATVSECIVDDSMLIDMPTGRVVDDGSETFLFTLNVVFTQGSWKVSYNTLEGQWEGLAGCALKQ